MAGKNIHTRAYWSTYGAITATGSTTLIDPPASDSVYLCYGMIDLLAATGTKKLDVIVASTTTHVFWSIDGTANSLGVHTVDFGDRGLRITQDAALYIESSAAFTAKFAFNGYTAE